MCYLREMATHKPLKGCVPCGLHVLQTASPLPSLAVYSPNPPQTKATAIDCSLECSSRTENVY